VIVTVDMDKSFDLRLQDPAASVLLCKPRHRKGSGERQNKVGKVTKAQIAEIAKVKAKDLTPQPESGIASH